MPAQAREVFDVSGAGDTVIAVLAVMLAPGAHARCGHAGKPRWRIVVSKLGTSTVTYEELLGGPT